MSKNNNMMRILTVLAALSAFISQAAAFSSAAQRGLHHASSLSAGHQRRRTTPSPVTSGTVLRMSDSPPSDGKGGMEKAKDKKKSLSTIVIDKTDTQMEEDETPEEMWRVVLHNDEVHTFNYVIRSLQKVMGTLDKKKAFDICTVTHGQGQATVTSCWKEQAMKYCLGLQRQGLTASIAPESKFEGGGGGEPESG
jgi:ATP-dependent Clp protease adapter protein ClpS